MALFEEKHYGKPISKELSTILVGDKEAEIDALINRDYIVSVCNQYNISYDNIWKTLKGEQKLTSKKGDAIKKLMQMAYEKALVRQNIDNKSASILNKLLNIIK